MGLLGGKCTTLTTLKARSKGTFVVLTFHNNALLPDCLIDLNKNSHFTAHILPLISFQAQIQMFTSPLFPLTQCKTHLGSHYGEPRKCFMFRNLSICNLPQRRFVIINILYGPCSRECCRDWEDVVLINFLSRFIANERY